MAHSIKAINARHPNLSDYGLTWPALEKLYKEHENLAAQHAETKATMEDLESRVQAEKSSLPERRAKALRSGDAVDTTDLEALEGKLQDAKTRLEDLKRAAHFVELDVTATIEAERGGYIEDLRERKRAATAEADKLRRALAVHEWEEDALERLAHYLTHKKVRGNYSFMGTKPRPVIPEVQGNGG